MKTTFSDYSKSPKEKEFEEHCAQARTAAISYIGISKKTSGRITGCLLKKGYPDSVIDTVLRELAEEGTINDHAIAQSVLKARTSQKSESSVSTFKRLIRLGIAHDIAEACVRDAFRDSDKERLDAMSILRLKFSQKLDTMDELDPPERLKLRQRMFRFLLNRGYGREVAMTAMNTVCKDGTDQDPSYYNCDEEQQAE